MNVKDFLQLSITKDFSVVAGGNGLHKPVQSVEILDFEFLPDIQTVRETTFTPYSVILSSLLFAKQQPAYLMDAIKNLIELKVSALAYKPVVFKDLPDEVLTFANEQNFPILRFGGDEFFEKIILETVAYTKAENQSYVLEPIIRRLIEEDLSTMELQTYLQQLHKPFDKYVCVANLQGTQWRQAFCQLEPLLKSGVICTFKESLFIIMTHHTQQFQFEDLLNELLAMSALSTDTLTIGYSQVHVTQTALHLAVRESFYARLMAEIEMMPAAHYKDLASDILLIELYRKDAQFAMDYAKNYLGPLLDEKVDPDLLNTAITYIIKKGNIKEIAVTHFCHPNTIRYRITKIRQLLAPLENDVVFYEHLSKAVKLYLLHSKMEQSTFALE